MAKSVEQKLYEAFRSGRGLRLSADEVWALLGPDDAIGTRITNAAADEAGIEDMTDWPGHDAISRNRDNLPTWAEFKKLVAVGSQ